MVSLEPRFAVVGLHRCFVCRSHHSVNEQDGHQQWIIEMEWVPCETRFICGQEGHAEFEGFD